ncbi:hypothetical protein [Pseudalkalibacillus hwajinpoensis]|uniref:Uncharacterized protein n=1 Tax=Guptibacillus hwajinpoensis TaxID=208199 RepID=A0A4U1MK81_9BACL|nr:hypothetical protein [Pseudalkalibacillus hwajinpoensis]TKD71869.1 hypothetical protein FBF83_03450 [Pseudalkalibacillus hwajinpoensis]
MASKLYVKLREYIGDTFSEIHLISSGPDDLILMNVTILEVSSNFMLVSQPGSGGSGEIMVPLSNVVAIME